MNLHFTSRNRIFIGILFIYACGVCFVLYHLLRDIDPRYRESAEDSMVETAHLLATYAENYLDATGQIDTESFAILIKNLQQRTISAKIYGIEKNRIDLRAYLVNHKGTVLFDSTGQYTGADFSQWRDINLTLQGKYGSRTTRDIQEDKATTVLYVSVPLYWQKEIIGVVTLGKPVGTYYPYIAKAQNKFLLVGIFSAVTIAILALIVAVWLTEPLGLITEYIRYVRSQKSINLPRLARRALDLFALGYENMRDALAGKHYVTTYVQNLTHELKSPLSAIRAAAELLHHPMNESQRHKFLNNIERETVRVQELVDHMRELTALEQRRSLTDINRINMTLLVQELIQSMQAIASTRQISIQFITPARRPELFVEGEYLLLHRALRNLLDNALEFSPDQGQIILELTSGKRTLTLSILDQGPGIPEYARTRIFEKYYSLPRPGKQKKSTGLGLAFVKEIILLHHGKITLNNITDAHQVIGTRAELQLPLSL